MKVITITEAKAQLSRLIEEVQSGKQIIIGKAGKPVAVLSAYEADTTPRSLGGSWEGRVVIAEDFDELPEELERAFAGEDS
ncbi:MAG: type II toxin-antitoxin system Phd/YefM family antitoxin [Egibacteraceae bacterium]